MITFVTGNDEKWQSANRLLQPYGVDLVRATFELPEIQSMDVGEVASAAAELACAWVGGPVMVTDAGYYFEALNGFPGPFVKYMNQTLAAEDVIRLMTGKDDRRVTIREALAYCEPGHAPVVFGSEQKAIVAQKVGQGRTTMDRLMILDGFDKVAGECTLDEVREFWARHLVHYSRLGEWLVGR
ncbi:MAG: hypothetical protein DI585_03735 [Pseudomonas fluorescens]|nr:MAG: hypothetical protein DI585_03735 [Pseudomonas fluorescens]